MVNMRSVSVLVLICALAAAGCKDKESSAAADPSAAQAELVARRDAMLKARQQLQTDRDSIDAEIKKVAAQGGDTTALAKKRQDLDSQIEGQSSQLIDALSSKLDSIQVAGDATAGIADREAKVARREAAVALRETEVLSLAKNFGETETKAAAAWKETCAVAAPATTIVQQIAAPKGSNYTRKDIEPLLSHARAAMAKKGLLLGDLPAQAQGLEGEATKGMTDGDWGRAYLAAAQLSATIDAVKLDRGFIMGKMNRLNSRVGNGKQDESTTQQLTEGMKDVLQKYGDGDFVNANRKLDQLWSAVK
jgi:chromosome segregation ATPase